MKTTRQSSDYETPDLYFAALLKTAKVPMKAPRWLDDRKTRCHFVFQNDGTGTIERLSLEWVNDEAKVAARSYSDNIKALKQLCHF
jgi:hypothetical protein